MAESAIEVVVQIGGEDVLAGRLWSHRRRGAESATFAYDIDYLARPDAYQLDPTLKVVAGQQQMPADRAIFGASSAGWTLSPAFDLNPDPSPGPKHLST